MILEAKWANIALRAKSVTRMFSEGLPLDSWEGQPRSDSGCQMGAHIDLGADSVTSTPSEGLPLDS